jgi:hypothetical protein
MSTREITIKQLHVTLPRKQAPRGRRDADTFAKALAASLADGLNRSIALRRDTGLLGSPLPRHVRVVVPRDKVQPTDIAHAIGKTIGLSGEER